MSINCSETLHDRVVHLIDSEELLLTVVLCVDLDCLHTASVLFAK